MADVKKDSVSSAASKSSSTGKSSSSSKDSSKPTKRKHSRASTTETSGKPSDSSHQGMAEARKASTSSIASKSSVSGRSNSLGKDSTNPTKRKKSRPSIAESSSKISEGPAEPKAPVAEVPAGPADAKVTKSKEKIPLVPDATKAPLLEAHAGPDASNEPPKATSSKEKEPPSPPKEPHGQHPSTDASRAITFKEKHVESNEKAQEKPMHRGKVNMLVVVPALVLLIAAIAAVIYMITLDKPRKRLDTCTSDDCAAFGRELRAAVNWSVDPCQDFHAFVCGGWSDPKRRETTESRMVAAALDLAIGEAKADLTYRSKATQFFESCTMAGKWPQKNLKEFADLRHSLGLPWPERKPSSATHPLDIMVNLALNWEMNFLFDLGTVTVRNSTALLVSRGRLDAVWEEKSRSVRTNEATYEVYVNDYYQVLNTSSAQSGVGAADLLGIETAFLNAKREFLYDTPRQEWFEVAALDSKTPSVKKSKPRDAVSWLALLRKHDRQFVWTGNDTVIIEDCKILESIDKLLKGMDHDKLIIGLSWMFIQTHLWAVLGKPSLRFGSINNLTQMKERGCMEYVESRLGLLGWATTLTERFGTKENRLNIASFLYRINAQTKRLINKLSWMDHDSKQMVFSKLDKMTRTILPGDSFFDAKERDRLYAIFPEMRGKTFVTNLVKTSEIYRALRSHKYFADVYSVRMFPRFGRERYLYLPDLMTLALVNLSPPMYYKEATLAINYGGLGSFAARQMATTFDDIGVTVDDLGKHRTWLGAEAAATHEIKANCNVHSGSDSSRWRPMRALPVMPGLEIAYEGFSAAVAADFRALEDLKVLHLEEFTDFQIFFLAQCYAVCAKRPQSMRDDCNVPAMNSPIFAEVFHCPANAPMNPPDKCTFFY
ncbi:neprilysin-1-like [Dermacentor albipictus]|uniref:neprilysin-1-like n=1 Tax=Dermacentor albipictus TaxID=60249 RepID=UPI0038FD24B8